MNLGPENNPNYDNKSLTYVSSSPLHSSIYRFKYSDKFITPVRQPSLPHPRWTSGFTPVLYRELPHQPNILGLLLTPQVASITHRVQYRYTDDASNQRIEIHHGGLSNVVETYKSESPLTSRIYMVGGVKRPRGNPGKRQGDSLEVTIPVSLWMRVLVSTSLSALQILARTPLSRGIVRASGQ